MTHAVLLVDDEPHVLAGLRRALRREPLELFCATSAEEGFVILHARHIDAVVSDQDMPGMPGTVFLAKVRQEFPDTVRFMLTGKATLEVALQAINEGAISRFFTKPCDHVELAIAMRQALQHRDLLVAAKRLLAGVRRQSAVLEQLERQFPGITRVRRDPSGAVLAEAQDVPIEELLQQLRAEASRLEARLRRFDP
ncbi:MAG: hypothetical protein KatS3mg131_3879 [Candidatus Tectimicrobiota bacterium]|nr:MAG: hypothetical protein KatS3mg131_3879 [Candidatus Tectomicrobia bacterium]